MSEWRTARLRDFCVDITDGDWIETKDQGGNDYRLLQVSNIGVGRFRETGNYRYVTRETFERLRCTEVSPGMVLVARMPDPVGRAWYVHSLAEPAITAVDVAIIQPDGDVLDSRFCAYLLNSPERLTAWSAAASGTTRMRITRRQLGDAEVCVPDVALQRRIGAVLGSLDDLIENNRRRIELLEQMAQAIYREWFVRFRYPGHEDATFVDSPLGPIPDGWSLTTCGEALTISGGGTPSKKEPAFWDGGCIPWYTPTDLTRARTRFAPEAGMRISEAGLRHSSARLFPAGSVMMTSRATLGVLAISTSAATCNQGFIVILPDERWPSSFIFEWLRDHALELEALGTGATFKEITKRAFKTVPFVLPPDHRLKAFAAVVDPIDDCVRNLLATNTRLIEFRDLLLPKLVTGKIDVSKLDLDALVGKAS